jgi:YjjI family glycine radical enzyme
MLVTAKPSFANHRMFKSDFGGDHYALASCYNGLREAGGGYTLPRLRLNNMAKLAKSPDDFINNVLPKYAKLMAQHMDTRIKFMNEEAAFFKSSYLIKEGFLDRKNFVGMFGLVGLAEAVNTLLGKDAQHGYGHDKACDDLGVKIIASLDDFISKHPAPYSENSGNRYWLHAQVRIPIGAEPEILKQIQHSTRFHKYFPTGVGDVFRFEETWKKSPEALVDIIRGALSGGMRYFSGYCENNDVVRVTGYLVKRSEIERLDRKEAVLNDATVLGQGSRDLARALDRTVVK